MARVEIRLLDEEWVRPGYRAVVGFKGFGAVGLIATAHLVESLKMKRVGIVLTNPCPEYVVVGEETLLYPSEIYVSKEANLLTLVTREVPPKPVRLEYVRRVAEFLKKLKIEYVVLIGGLDSRLRSGPDDLLRWLANEYYSGKKPQDKQFERYLAIIGPLALFLMMCEILRLPAIVLLPYATVEAPDPAAAAVALNRLSDITGVRIDVEELLREAERIQAGLKKIEEIIQASHEERVRERVYV